MYVDFLAQLSEDLVVHELTEIITVYSFQRTNDSAL